MRDEGLQADGKLCASERAVNYFLRRMTVDVDLRYIMLNTEAFNLMCVAEADRTGKTEEQIIEVYSSMAPHCAGDRPRLLKFQDKIEELEERVSELSGSVAKPKAKEKSESSDYDFIRLLNLIGDLYGRKQRQELELILKVTA